MSLSLLAAAAAGLIAGSVGWADLKAADTEQKNRLQLLEARVNKLEDIQIAIAQDIANTKTNVEWMRRWMEGRYATTPTPPRP